MDATGNAIIKISRQNILSNQFFFSSTETRVGGEVRFPKLLFGVGEGGGGGQPPAPLCSFFTWRTASSCLLIGLNLEERLRTRAPLMEFFRANVNKQWNKIIVNEHNVIKIATGRRQTSQLFASLVDKLNWQLPRTTAPAQNVVVGMGLEPATSSALYPLSTEADPEFFLGGGGGTSNECRHWQVMQTNASEF